MRRRDLSRELSDDCVSRAKSVTKRPFDSVRSTIVLIESFRRLILSKTL